MPIESRMVSADGDLGVGEGVVVAGRDDVDLEIARAGGTDNRENETGNCLSG